MEAKIIETPRDLLEFFRAIRNNSELKVSDLQGDILFNRLMSSVLARGHEAEYFEAQPLLAEYIKGTLNKYGRIVDGLYNEPADFIQEMTYAEVLNHLITREFEGKAQEDLMQLRESPIFDFIKDTRMSLIMLKPKITIKL